MFDMFDELFGKNLDPETRKFWETIAGRTGCAGCGAKSGLKEFPPDSGKLLCGTCAMKAALKK